MIKDAIKMKRILLIVTVVGLVAELGYGHTWMCQWTPKGWTSCLGPPIHKACYVGGWPVTGEEWLRETLVREKPEVNIKSLRAQLIADAVTGVSDDADLWRALSGQVSQEAVPNPQEAASPEQLPTKQVEIPEKLKRATVNAHGVIRIPGVACTVKGEDAANILFIESTGGGMQMHLCRLGKEPEKSAFAYTFDAPRTGTYQLTAEVVTIHNGIGLTVSVNGSKAPLAMEMPYTVGMWETSKPVTVELLKGSNTLLFAGEKNNPPLSIKEFVLKREGEPK